MQKYNSKFKSDLVVRCYNLSLKVIFLADTFPTKKSAWIIADQLIRSATSIGANLVEARASSSRIEFKKFHEIALKSANETQYWLCLLRDSHFIETEKVNVLLNEVIEISKMIASGVIKLKQKN